MYDTSDKYVTLNIVHVVTITHKDFEQKAKTYLRKTSKLFQLATRRVEKIY